MHERFVEIAERELSRSLEKIQVCVGLLTEDELWWRANESSNSVGNLLLHLRGNLSQWVLSGVGGEPYERRRWEEFAARGAGARQELLDQLSTVVADCRRVIRSSRPEQLSAPCTIQGYETDGLYAVFHAIEHFGYHTGQIVFVAKELAGRRAEIEFFPHLKGK